MRHVSSMLLILALAGACSEGVRDIARNGAPQRTRAPLLDNESYEEIAENEFHAANEVPLSTFSIDVDTASYSNVRRFLTTEKMPPAAAVRIEEFINYFPYAYEGPTDGAPIAPRLEVADCPWHKGRLLARIALKARELPERERPACNLVFLLDVSGSMSASNKLPLVKRSLQLLVPQLTEDDRVAIVVYAGEAGLVLPSTPGSDAQTILAATEALRSGGSTDGGSGIRLAYKIAAEGMREGGINRVILATDGDFNVGTRDRAALVHLVQGKAAEDIDLTVLGFGIGNIKDATLEQIADKGNGHYAYIDSIHEARKVLVDQIGSTLVTVAKDVKIQVEFNPASVSSYRLIGYENRRLAARDFNDDTKDAGEIGAGHAVTALYEIIPVGAAPLVDPLRYQATPEPAPTSRPDELLHVKVRYKLPGEDSSHLLEVPLRAPQSPAPFTEASEDMRFAASVASFGMLLRDSKHKGTPDFETVMGWAADAMANDPGGWRAGFLKLVDTARVLANK